MYCTYVLRPATGRRQSVFFGWDMWITRHVKRKALHDGSCKAVPSQRSPGRCSAAQTRDRTCGAGRSLHNDPSVNKTRRATATSTLLAGRPISLHVGPGALTSTRSRVGLGRWESMLGLGGWSVVSSPVTTQDTGLDNDPTTLPASCVHCADRAASASLRPHALHRPPDQTFTLGACMVAVCNGVL
jgi:hypothetical protein